MKLDQIIDAIELGLISSPTSFEAVANGGVTGVDWGADRMPESWVVASVMQEVQKIGIAAVPEVKIKDQIGWFETGGAGIDANQLPNLKQGGAKIDLVLGDKSPIDGKRLHFRVAIEIKGPKSNWQQFRGDIDRIHELQSILHDEEQAVIFAYVTCPLTVEGQEAEAKKLAHCTGLELAQFRIGSAVTCCVTNNAWRSYVYMYIIRGKAKEDKDGHPDYQDSSLLVSS